MTVKLRFELLEDRVVPAAGIQEEQMLELINAMRVDPADMLPALLNSGDANVNNALSYFNVNTQVLKQQWATLTPVPPLIWNDDLASAALGHSQLMSQDQLQEHQLPGELDLTARIAAAGYVYGPSYYVGENIFAYVTEIFYGFAGFAIDWGQTTNGIQDPPGHRENIMDANFQEMGVGIVTPPSGSTVGPLVLTEDFGGGRLDYGNPYLVGAAYNASAGSGLYDPNQVLANVTITATGANGIFTAITDAAGGYQLQLPAGSYSVTASGGSLAANLSQDVTIGSNSVLVNFVPGKPSVTTQPTSQTVDAGNQATFTAAGTGNPDPNVQWQVSTDGGKTFSDVAKATSTTLTLTPDLTYNGNLYRAMFSNAIGTATTAAAKLTVDASPTVTTEPADLTVAVGGKATFTAAVSANPAASVQWQVSTGGGQFTDISGATSTTLTVATPLSASGNQYQAVFTNLLGTNTSNPATLTVDVPPAITAQPAGTTVTAGDQVSFTAAASGLPAGTIKWQVSSDGGKSYADVPNATSATLSFTAQATQNGDLYRAVFMNPVGKATTAAAALKVKFAPIITSPPEDLTRNAGQTARFIAAAQANPAATVQWQVSGDGTNYNNLTGATGRTLVLTPRSGQNGYYYRAIFSNAVGSTPTDRAQLTVDFAPIIITPPTSQIVAVNTQATFTANASANPGPAGIQWQVSTNHGTTFSNISGESSGSLTFTAPLSDNGWEYRALFTNSVGKAFSKVATLTVDVPPTVTTPPADKTVNAGSIVTFTAKASGTNPKVQWQVMTAGGSFANITGATSITLSFRATAADNGNQYRAVFTNPVGQVPSTAATLTVDFAPIVTTQPASQTVSSGTQAIFTVSANGNPAIAMHWQVSTNGGKTFSAISGETATTLTVDATAADNGNRYRVLFTNSIGKIFSKTVLLTVN